jgi:3-hydroxyisobutyrate dehydrogenase
VTNRAEAVGFVGAGAMGSEMVARMSKAGWNVLVYDIDPSRRQEVARMDGVAEAASRKAFDSVSLVICMLPSSDEADAVVAGPEGLLSVLPARALIVDMSSSDPHRTVKLAGKAREHDVQLADAPVSGGVAKAKAGELTIMFGGGDELLGRCRPVLSAIGSTIVSVGFVGSGHAMKALNNLLSATGLAAAGEVMEIGRRFGLDQGVMLQVINSSTGRNHATENKIAQFVLSETFASGFALRLMSKDVAIAVNLGRAEGVPMPMSEACMSVWHGAAEHLPPGADHTRVAELPRVGAPSGGR